MQVNPLDDNGQYFFVVIVETAHKDAVLTNNKKMQKRHLIDFCRVRYPDLISLDVYSYTTKDEAVAKYKHITRPSNYFDWSKEGF